MEDAIEEVQVLTTGISAEYGRFSGGVINAITRSGGNRFSGSYRVNLSRPSWTNETPFDPASPLDLLGLPTAYVEGPRFGQGTSNGHYPLPRTFLLAFGLRF